MQLREHLICFENIGFACLTVYLNSDMLRYRANRNSINGVKRMEILLRSSWQTVNIGDISHTPALLALIEKYIPEAKVTVWASADITPDVMEMEKKRFPDIEFVKGDLSDSRVMSAVKRADFFLHGSGPFLVGSREMKMFTEISDKGCGVFGITYRSDMSEIELMEKCRFVYFRDSDSLRRAKLDCPDYKEFAFGPDAAFATDLRNEEKAQRFLEQSGLKEKEFVCCIPRLRNTPYWELGRSQYNEKNDLENKKYAAHDHAYLIRAITDIVSKTGKKVLICPEDMTQIKVGREELYEKLPQNIKNNVVLRESFWLPDEALSVYVKSLGLFGNEMHSPIMCIGNNIPAVVVRWKQQTSKGLMWSDIGLDEWLFDSDMGVDENVFSETVLKFITDRSTSKEKARKANDFVKALHKKMTEKLKDSIM